MRQGTRRSRGRTARRLLLLALIGAGASGVMTSPAPSLAAGPLDSLSYRIHTVYQTPEGQRIDRMTDSILLVPTPVDVDGNLTTGIAGAELLSQLTIDAGRATMRVTALPGAPAHMPLLVEAILADPRQSSQLRVAFGYDGLAAGAPDVFQATIHLVGASRVTSFGLDVETANPASTLAVIAEVFTEGAGGQRIDPQRGRVGYTPVPAVTHFGVLQGSDFGTQQSGLDLVTDIPTRVDVLIEDIRGNDSVRSSATIDKLPNTVSLVLTESGDGRNTWSYQATDRIGLVALNIRQTKAAAIVDDFSIRLEDMALTANLVQDTPTHMTFQAESPIGAIQAGSATGRGIAFLNDPAYVYSTKSGATDSFAFRILGLSKAELDTGDPFIADVTIKPGPLHVLIEDGPATIDGWIRDLPGRIRLEISTAAGTIEWQGSARVGEIVIDATDPGGFGGRATRLHLRLQDIPQTLSLAYGQAGGETKLDAHDSAIGSVDLLLTSGPVIEVDEGFDGVVLEDVADHEALVARITGLRLVSVSTGEPPYRFTLNKSPGPFLISLTQGARDTRVEVHDLPDSLSGSFDPAGSLDVSASAVVGLVTAELRDPDGLSGRATRASLRIESIPRELSLTFASGGTASVDAHGATIGRIDLLLTSGPVIGVDPGFDGIVLEDVEDHFALVVRITGLKVVSASTGDAPYALRLEKAPGPFLVHLTQGARDTRIEIHDLPSSLTATLDPAGSLSYTASAPMSSITATLTDPAGVAGRATSLDLAITDVPAALSLTYSTGSTASIDAHGSRIGRIDLHMTSGPVIEVEDGFDGVVLEDVPAHYALAVRLVGLRSASLSTTAPYALAIAKDAGPFLVHLVQGEADTRVEIRDLPDSLTATFDPDNGSISYTASATIASLAADLTDPAGVAGRANRLRVRLAGLPQNLTLTYATGGAASIDAHGGQVGSIDILATSGPELAVDPGFDGIVLEDMTDHFAFAVKLSGLRVVNVSTGSAPYTLQLSKNAGPFLVSLLQGARSIRVEIRDLPSSLTATMDPAGTLTYTASAAIGELKATLSDPAGISGRATRAVALLRGLPTSLDVSWGGSGGAMTADAKGATVGLLEVLLTSGPDATLPADRDGIILHDLSDRWVVFARVTGLRLVQFAQGPPPSFRLDTIGGRRFDADLQTQKAGGVATTSASLQTLPASVSIKFTGPTALSYTASGSLASLTLDAYDPAGISGRANTLHAIINSIPSALDVSWTSSGVITLDGKGGTIGLVEIQLTSGPDDRLASQYDGLLLKDLQDRYVVFARLTGLRKVVGQQDPLPDITVESTGNRVLRVDLQEWTGSKLEYTLATLDRLPSTVRIRMSDSGGQQVFYDASARTNSIQFESNSGDRWKITASVSNPLPSHVYMCSAGNGFCTGFARSSGAGSFKFDASEHTTVDVFDCKRPLSAGCVRGGGDDFTDLRNWRVKHVEFDADFDDVGFSGYTFMNTNGEQLTGYLLNQSGSGGFEANFDNGFWASNRRVSWDAWGLFKSKSGSISCPGNTYLSVRVLGFWLGVTSYLC